VDEFCEIANPDERQLAGGAVQAGLYLPVSRGGQGEDGQRVVALRAVKRQDVPHGVHSAPLFGLGYPLQGSDNFLKSEVIKQLVPNLVVLPFQVQDIALVVPSFP
jgi:hypothetical protein